MTCSVSRWSMSFRLVTLGLLTLTLAACGGFERGEPSEDESADTDTDVPGGGDGPSFAATVAPILNARCSACHGGGGVAASTAFRLSGDASTDYGVVSALVSPSSPAASKLLQEATGVSHGGGAVIAADSDDYRTILAWITGGALP